MMRRCCGDLGENHDPGRRSDSKRKDQAARMGGSSPKPPGYFEPADDKARVNPAVQAGTPMTAPGDATRPWRGAGSFARLSDHISAASPREQPRGTLDTPAGIREHAISAGVLFGWGPFLCAGLKRTG